MLRARKLVLGLLAWASSGGAVLCAGPAYTLTPIGCLPGTIDSYADCVSPTGQVVGYSNTTGGHNAGFLYSNGNLTNLGLLPGGTSCAPMSVNASKQIVGGADDGNQGHAFIYQNGVMTNLGTLPGDIGSNAYGINTSGQVVGISWYFSDRAFLYSNGTMTDLTALTGMAGYATAINDSGQVVGMAELSGNQYGIDHAYNFTTKTDLGTLGGQNSDAYGINAGGQVVGYADNASGGWHPFVYSGGQMIDLGSFNSAWPNGAAYGINTAGQIVGYMENGTTSAGHAFLYSNGQMSDLNSLISPTLGFTLEVAYSINDAGQIAGYGLSSSGQALGFLLTPIPEPSTIILLAIGALSLLVYGWRRRLRASCTISPPGHRHVA